MYHNSATPPLPACYDDTCEPPPLLNMLSHTVGRAYGKRRTMDCCAVFLEANTRER